MVEDCEVFAATMTGGPTACMHVIAAGRGKVCYNVESHINHGCTDVHQPVVEIKQLLHDLLPQLGMGIKGVLFWQYRSEVLGFEAPAWGLVKTDGSPRPVTAAVRQFWSTLKPYAVELRQAFPRPAEIGLWRSRKNEIFHFCLQGQVTTFNKAIDAYIQALYWNNLPFTLVNDRMLANGELSGLKLLIMPKCYYVTQEEAQALDRWVRAGGILLCEAHLAGYNGTTGRHSQRIPGCGLANSWGFHEEDSTSPFYLRLDDRDEIDTAGLPDDVRKALKEFGSTGGQYFPIVMEGGALVWGAHRYAELSGDRLEALGRFSRSSITLARQTVGKGVVFYCGTDLSEAAAGKDPSGLETILRMASKEAAVERTGGIDQELAEKIHLDILYDGTAARFAVLINRTKQEQLISLPGQGHWHGLFSGIDLELGSEEKASIPGDFEDIFRIGGE
jgi:beta-galactosidase